MATISSDRALCPTKRMFQTMSTLPGKERREFLFGLREENMLKYRSTPFKTRADDLFIVTFRKCGTTWTQQIAKLIRNGGREDGTDVDEAFPWIEMMPPQEASDLPSPRGFKSHLPYCLLPGGEPHTTSAKYISVYRNPKDVAVSSYHQYKSLFHPEADWDDYCDEFLSGKPKGPSGNCLKYFLEWWQHRDDENILILSYEWMKANHREAVETIAKFIGCNLTPSEISAVVEQTTFESMKKNPAANLSWMDGTRLEANTTFMRKGIVGNWKDYFTEEQSARMDEEIKKTFSGTGLEFEFS